MTNDPEYQTIFEREMRGCFDYFWLESNSLEGSPGYGITRDQAALGSGTSKADFGSVAATGFALAAYAIGVEKGYVPLAEARRRCLGTLDTFLHGEVAQHHGFFHHFLHLSTGKRWGHSEVSVIDTALFIAGAITAGEYFGADVQAKARAIFERVNWPAYVDGEKQQFVMGYYDETGFIPHTWDHFAEHLIMCILGAGSPTYPSEGKTLYAFERIRGAYGGHEYIRTRHNALFVHQFSHAFIDFRGTVDLEGIDWYENSVQASLGHCQYCKDNPRGHATFSEKSWGLSACHHKHGYSGAFGAEPYCPGSEALIDGTVAIYAALASMPFTPNESRAALSHYATFPELWGRYGLTDSYNLDEQPPFFDDVYLGIDKGISLAMMANHENEFVWRHFMQCDYVRTGLAAAGVQNV